VCSSVTGCKTTAVYQSNNQANGAGKFMLTIALSSATPPLIGGMFKSHYSRAWSRILARRRPAKAASQAPQPSPPHRRYCRRTDA
jgi:hypothetical protein